MPVIHSYDKFILVQVRAQIYDDGRDPTTSIVVHVDVENRFESIGLLDTAKDVMKTQREIRYSAVPVNKPMLLVPGNLPK
ncbi:MAG: hypothetical protein HY673_14205 [Chloroflexi bacterium]|nr:hypothetical protein [Chloroflexota bacterium]